MFDSSLLWLFKNYLLWVQEDTKIGLGDHLWFYHFLMPSIFEWLYFQELLPFFGLAFCIITKNTKVRLKFGDKNPNSSPFCIITKNTKFFEYANLFLTQNLKFHNPTETDEYILHQFYFILVLTCELFWHDILIFLATATRLGSSSLTKIQIPPHF